MARTSAGGLRALAAVLACASFAAPSSADRTDTPLRPIPSSVDGEPTAREGASIARSADGEWLYVVDEPTRSLYVAPTSSVGADFLPAKKVPLPGRPAQIVALRVEVLVTVREP